MKAVKPALIIGVDLAASPQRPTGLCFLQELVVSTQLVYENQEILFYIKEKKPSLVAIDAPLSRPLPSSGRQGKNGLILRACDAELRNRRIPLFPLNFKAMQQLMGRGIALRKKVEALGIKVIEVYPGAAQDIWRLPRAKRQPSALILGLKRFGLKGLREKMTHHELDAVTAALVGYYYLLGRAEEIGQPEEGLIVLPLKEKP